MDLLIKKSGKNNFFTTEYLTREAFWNLYKSGCDEHLVLHQLRESGCYVSDLDLVGILEGEIIGHIISSMARVIDQQNKEHEVLCVGPISVSPPYQNKGIGTQLMNYSITEATKLGFKGMILFGNPEYYHRFGFRNAKEFEITTKDSLNFEPFMALELGDKGLMNVTGRFFEDEAFEIKEEQLIEFEKKFPPKEKGKPKIDINI
ncbi:MAG: N-acetyltransferase [Bacteroidetes bacterium]|nr:N-acetyltransferase [Bacteroidota bacterium]